MPFLEETYDIAVVGAGHAGCEAALACARMGLETVLFTVSVDSIALMPCNPNIGGSSKGHLVREVDALGGEMGKNIDKTFIQSKMLNKSKGPAVHSLRAQADKQEYSRQMRMTLENTEHDNREVGYNRSTYLFWCVIPLQMRGFGHRNISECPLYLRRCEQCDRAQWTAGSHTSDGFFKIPWNRDVPL